MRNETLRKLNCNWTDAKAEDAYNKLAETHEHLEAAMLTEAHQINADLYRLGSIERDRKLRALKKDFVKNSARIVDQMLKLLMAYTVPAYSRQAVKKPSPPPLRQVHDTRGEIKSG